jgi:hypothetical protein
MSVTKTPREELFIAVPRELFYVGLTAHGFMVMAYLLEQVDYNTGIVKTDARKILDGMNAGGVKKCQIRSVQIGLKEAEAAGLIKTFYKKGSVYEYPILIEGFRVRQGKLKGLILDAKDTLNPKKPVYAHPKAPEPTNPSVSLGALKESEIYVTENNTGRAPSASLGALNTELQRTTSAPSAHLQRTFSALGAGVIQESQEHQENQSINQSIKRLNEGFAKATGAGLGMGAAKAEFEGLIETQGFEVVSRMLELFANDSKHNWKLVNNPARLFLARIDDYLPLAKQAIKSAAPVQVSSRDWTDEFEKIDPDALTPEQELANRHKF